MKPIFSFVIVVLTVAVSAAGDNWPQFRGPEGKGLSDSRNLPTEWSESKNVRWKTAIHDKGWSSPVVWGDQIWLTTAREDGKEMFAICVDRKSGKILHDLKLLEIGKPDFCHPYNSYASPTPVIEDGRVYIHFGSYGTFCLDTASGKILWERRDLKCDHFRGPGSSPVILGDSLFLTFDGYDLKYVAVLNKKTGETVWKKDRNIKYSTDNADYHKAYGTPGILELKGKKQVVSSSAEATIAYDPEDGTELWRVHHGGMNEATIPLFGHGFIYLTSGHTKQLVAVKQGGSGTIAEDGIGWKTNKGVPSRSSPLLIDDHIFMVSDDGIASCVEAKSGKGVWQERLGAACSASPILCDGFLYFADEAGNTHVFAVATTAKKVATNKLDAGCMASLAVSGDSLFLRTKTHLYCLGK